MINNEWNQVDQNSRRRILQMLDESMLVEVEFINKLNEDTIIPLHHHIHEQLTFVKEGKFKFAIVNNDGELEEILVEKGDTLAFRSNIEHGCIPLSDNGLLIDFFTPIRNDFLS